jgi:copper/silver efflux system protein
VDVTSTWISTVQAAARYGLNIADVQSIVAGAIGGENVGETIEGLARFPINVRYPREWRDSLSALGAVADLHPARQPDHPRHSGEDQGQRRARRCSKVKTHGLRAGCTSTCVAGTLHRWSPIYVRLVSEQVKLQPGMSLSYSGQFEFLERANARLKLVVPATLLIIFVLLYLTFATASMRPC